MSFIPSAITKAIITSFAKEAKALANVRSEQDKTIQKALDCIWTACTIAKPEFMKGNSKTNAARAEVKAIFDALVEGKYIAKASGAMYQSSFWIAFETSVPFKRDLASKAKPEATGAAPAPKRTVSASRENLDRVLNQALSMARALGLNEFAASILDVALDTLEGFAEKAE